MNLFCLFGFLLISTIGTLLHFVYDWTKHNKFLSPFVAVNESSWEHLKLGVMPTFVWAIIGLFFPPINNYAFGVLIALLTIMIVIPAIFYTYRYFFKKNNAIVNISSFFVAVGMAMFFASLIFSAIPFTNFFNIIGIIGTILILLSFVLFTFFPPKCFLFKDPLTNNYGRRGHYEKKE